MITDSSAHGEAGEFLERIVSLYNAGVRTRNFDGFLALLGENSVLDFEGVPERGELTGKAAIAQHFIDDPPDDPITVTRWKSSGNAIVAEFRWADIPEGSGCLFIEPRDGYIERITIAVGGPRRKFR